MLDFGWAELFLIVAAAVLVVGPKDIPGVMRGLGRLVRRLSYLKYSISNQFENFMREADIEDLRRQVNFEDRPSSFDEEEADAAYEDAQGEDDPPKDKKEPPA